MASPVYSAPSRRLFCAPRGPQAGWPSSIGGHSGDASVLGKQKDVATRWPKLLLPSSFAQYIEGLAVIATRIVGDFLLPDFFFHPRFFVSKSLSGSGHTGPAKLRIGVNPPNPKEQQQEEAGQDRRLCPGCVV